ncbi:MAG: scyllo-inositol 2-dehydrogenase [Phycisphaerales bacterium]|jgi:predicted dehydrogenase|nr:scyllo-inositol 2-dehydrogenase [Phycisphaerales bacterium]
MLSVGIIGFGRIGAEHARWLQSAQGIRAVATSDPTPARRAIAEKGGLRAHDSVDALINDENVDIVLVSTPTAMHHQHGSAALGAGKHVMVEKPMALDFAQSKSLVEFAERQQRVLSVFHNRRWDIDYLTVKQAIDAGTLGNVFNIESRIAQWASCVGPAAREWRPGWRNEAGFGGGGLYDWGSHFIDQLWRMMLPAKAVRVFAQLRGNVWTKDCDDLARVLIDFDSGAVGMVEINTTTTRPLPRWHIDGTRGSGESPYSLAFDLNIWSQVTFAPADGAAAELLPRATESLSETQIWEQFAAAVRGEEEPAVLARSVLPTMTLLDAARESSRRGCAIDVDLPQ